MPAVHKIEREDQVSNIEPCKAFDRPWMRPFLYDDGERDGEKCGRMGSTHGSLADSSHACYQNGAALSWPYLEYCSFSTVCSSRVTPANELNICVLCVTRNAGPTNSVTTKNCWGLEMSPGPAKPIFFVSLTAWTLSTSLEAAKKSQEYILGCVMYQNPNIHYKMMTFQCTRVQRKL